MSQDELDRKADARAEHEVPDTQSEAAGTPAFEGLLALLKDERGFDFTGYKRASLERRVRRRMQELSLTSYEEYADQLRMHQDEFTALFNTILINVTSFYRDRDSWSYLAEELVPALLRRREDQPLRAWCAGCASGEEAYTLAMVLAEALGIDEFRERVKIYATDVDEDALSHARMATYGANDLEAVPPTLREKYFEAAGSRFVFRKELRRGVIFGRNDLVQDAPISHVDVLTCRNTLMYFTAEAQSHVLNRLHFALKPDGVLFLGRAEMLLSHGSKFTPIDLRRRFFRKVSDGRLDRPVPAYSTVRPAETEDHYLRLQRAALITSAAAQIVLDGDGRLALCNNRATYLFGLSHRDIGRPIQDLEMSYRPVELRSHIDEAVNEQRPVWVRDVTLSRGSAMDALSLDVQVVPLADDSGRLGVTVIFNDVTQFRQLQQDLQVVNTQLETAYEELQSTNEELETTNEELQSTVEELETTNEELQSTNEELETMNEELQSMNDEFRLNNEQLRTREVDLDRASEFMSSLFSSMDTGVAVVDPDLTVLAWNAKAEELWGIRESEAVGSTLTRLDFGLPVDLLLDAIREHLAGTASDPWSTTVDAVNRRGRPLRVRVTLTHVANGTEQLTPGTMLMMDVVDAPG